MKMKKSIKIISAILALIMIFQVIPYSVVAIAAEEVKPEQIVDETAKIIGEVESMRDEYTKVYLREDGTYSAIKSTEPFHYLKDDKWVDIDNTLVKTEDSDGNVVLTNQSNAFDVTLPTDMNSEVPITVKKDDVSIAFSINEVDSEKNIGAKVNKNSYKNDLTELQQMSNVEKLNSEVVYSDVTENVDVQYNITNNSIKESIIVSEKPTEKTEYSFSISVKGLTAKQKADGSIEFKKGNKNVVFTIPAPFMFDSNNVFSEDIDVRMTKHGNEITLTYAPSYEWLGAEERTYPVTIDPIIVTDSSQVIFDSYVSDAEGDTFLQHSSESEAIIGKIDSVNYGTLFNFNNIADASESVVTNAKLNFYAKTNTSADVNVLARLVKDVSLSASAPGTSLLVTHIDSLKISGQSYKQYSVDVTSVLSANKNSDNTDYSLYLISQSSNDGVSATLLTSESNSTEYSKPVLEYDIVETTGISDRFDYHTYDVGRAGTVYVNDFTGGMYISRNDIGIDGNIMPVSITHYFSSAAPNPTGTLKELYNYHGGVQGKWFNNYQQYVGFIESYYRDAEGNSIDLYHYIDENGSTHYFSKTTEERDGYEVWKEFTSKIDMESSKELLVKIPDSASSIDRTNYSSVKIIDDSEQTLEFDSYGRLVKIISAPDENATITPYIQIVYQEINSSKSNILSIDKIIDGVGRYYKFTYDSTGFLTKIKAYTSDGTAITIGGDALEINYSKNSYGVLSDVEYPDSEHIKYTTSDPALKANCITKIENVDGYNLRFSTINNYTYSGVYSISEYYGNTKESHIMSSSSGPYGRTFTDQDTGEKEIKQFDRYGRTISVANEDREFLYYKYDDVNIAEEGEEPEYKNMLIDTGYVEASEENLLQNSDFEGSLTPWVVPSGNVTDSSATVDSSVSLNGSSSLKLTGNANGTARVAYNFGAIETGTYTFSVYVKLNEDITESTGKFRLYAKKFHSDGNATTYSDYVTTKNETWQKLSVTFDVTEENTTVQLNICAISTSATAYFDCAKLEKVDYSTGYNIAENGKMMANPSTNLPLGWTGSSLTNSDIGKTVDKFGETVNAMYFTGAINREKSISQTIQIDGEEGDIVSFGAYFKSSGTLSQSNENAVARIRVEYTDGTEEKTVTSDYIPYITDWQYTAVSFTLTEACDSVTIYLDYYNQYSACYFTDARVMFTDGEPEEEVEEDTTEEATLCVCGENCVYGEGCECECESEAACTCLECKETTSYTYDSYGNVLSTETTNLVDTIKTEQSYTPNGNYLQSATNSAGNTVNYNYNMSNGTLTSVTDAENNTVNYTYTAMNELASATQTVSGLTNGNSLSYSAEYSQDRLTGITTGNGVNYTYEYDSKGRQDKVKVENKTIVSYGYGTGDNSGRVESVTYANGLTITYAYDESGNIIGISYDGGATYAYEYQYGDGALTLLRDNINGQTTYYSDDGYSIYVTPVDEGAEETLLYTCTYDDDGNFIETTGDATYAHVFEEEKYDKATGETTTVYTIQDRKDSGNTENPYVYGSSFDITVTDVSDYFGRAKQRVVKNVSGETTKFQMTTSYGYYAPDSSTTSELLTSYNNTISADDYTAKNINYTYSYDDNGNITEIHQNGTLINKYYYDEAGQVIREDWAQQEKTITYSYDNGGNIASKNEYAYTNSDVLGEAVASNTFSYSNYAWKDQLTSVNGEQITYDALGNPVSYGDDITYTWNGRQLLEYKNSNTDDYIRCVYTYDADGLRTRKLVYTYKSSTDKTEYLLKQYDYVWKDGILDSEKYVSYDEDGVVTKTVVYKYLYDEYNSPIGIALWVDGEKNGNYWYIKNAQGDVTAIYCEGQGIVVNYNYDAYGNMKAVAGENGLAGAVVMILYNSITYRGYYFDIDTNLYYLQSRYYFPEWGRFINADDVEYLGVSGTALSYNLYAYCENDPVNGSDPNGCYNIKKFNCYAYAFGRNNKWLMPGKGLINALDKKGKIKDRFILPDFYSVDTVVDWIIKDFWGIKVRKLSGKSSKLKKGEYMIAVRVVWYESALPKGVAGPPCPHTLDFHLWKQDPETKKWWSKPGEKDIVCLGKVDPENDKNWSYSTIEFVSDIIFNGKRYQADTPVKLHYNSKTIYLAYKGKFWTK